MAPGAEPDTSATDSNLIGLVVAGYGRRVLVEDEARQRLPCVLKGRRLRAVVGDRVHWTPPEQSGDGRVTEILPRKNELQRPDSRGRPEVIASNVTQLMVVSGVAPKPDAFLVDRYLIAAALMPANAVVILNKTDLLPEDKTADDVLPLDDYRRVGYRILTTCAKSGGGLQDLLDALAGHTSILVGQSGVGKSSLINVLLPDVNAAVQEISASTGYGKHTTTASILHHLPGGGALIDSPGVRDYAPAPVEDARIADGYLEFQPHIGKCRFSDCMHLEEPDCAIKEQVASGGISERRYRSYRHVVDLMRRLRSPAY